MKARNSHLTSVPAYALVFLLAFSNACGGVDDTAARNGFGLVFASGVSSGCETSPPSTGSFPDDVDWIVARLLDATGAQTSVMVLDDATLEKPGEAIITGVPPGRYRLDVTGCVADGGTRATWGGISREFDVAESGKSAPIVFMTRAGAMSCVGGWNQSPLAPGFGGDDFIKNGGAAFGAGVVTAEGRVYVGGGFDQWSPKVIGDVLTAGDHLWEFDPRTGIFIGSFALDGSRNQMDEARALHLLVEPFGAAGRLLAVGGVKSAVLAPKGFPGSQAPLEGAGAVESALGVIDIDTGKSTGVGFPQVGVQASAAVSRDGKRVALAGGRVTLDGKPSGVVVIAASEPDKLLDGSASIVEGTLASPRFGSTAIFLSSGDLLLVGGWDGNDPAVPEVVKVDGDPASIQSTSLAVGATTAGASPTAFPSVFALPDSKGSARVLVLGGNPLDDPSLDFVNPNADRTTGWILEIPTGSDGHSDTGAATAVSPGADPEWAVRSLAPMAEAGQGSILLAGGYRKFTDQPSVPGCGSVWGSFCFPRTMVQFSMDAGGTGIVTGLELEDSKSRLGAVVLPLGDGRVLVMGGMDGFGYPKPAGTAAPPPPSTTPILSTGYVFTARDHFDSAVCTAHQPL